MNTNDVFENMLSHAHIAAGLAVQDMGPENPNAFDCGFAWCRISGNDPLARYCRKMVTGKDYPLHQRYGRKAHPSGWQWWNPGQFAGQAIGHKEAGAKAFRDALAAYNVRVDVGSRLD